VAASADGSAVFVDDREYPPSVRELAPDQTVVIDHLMQRPQGLAIDGSGMLYVSVQPRTGSDNVRVMQVSAAGDVAAKWTDTGSGPGEFGGSEWGVAIDGAGNIYIADTRNNRVQELASDGTPITEWDGLHAPCGVAVDANGNVYVADTAASRVVEFAPDGTQLASWGDWGTDVGHFRWPMAVAVDPTGATIYVADTFNDRLVAITPSAR